MEGTDRQLLRRRSVLAGLSWDLGTFVFPRFSPPGGEGPHQSPRMTWRLAQLSFSGIFLGKPVLWVVGLMGGKVVGSNIALSTHKTHVGGVPGSGVTARVDLSTAVALWRGSKAPRPQPFDLATIGPENPGLPIARRPGPPQPGFR